MCSQKLDIGNTMEADMVSSFFVLDVLLIRQSLPPDLNPLWLLKSGHAHGWHRVRAQHGARTHPRRHVVSENLLFVCVSVALFLIGGRRVLL